MYSRSREVADEEHLWPSSAHFTDELSKLNYITKLNLWPSSAHFTDELSKLNYITKLNLWPSSAHFTDELTKLNYITKLNLWPSSAHFTDEELKEIIGWKKNKWQEYVPDPDKPDSLKMGLSRTALHQDDYIFVEDDGGGGTIGSQTLKKSGPTAAFYSCVPPSNFLPDRGLRDARPLTKCATSSRR